MSATTTLRWRAGSLETADDCEVAPVALQAADSWLVEEGRVLALDLHRERFAAAVAQAEEGPDAAQAAAFWEAAIAALPREGAWFPRVELRRVREAPELRLLLRPAPRLARSVRLATHSGRDPRTAPTVKGPDLEAMLRLRGEAQQRGADEAVLLSGDGYVVEGSTSALAWWAGDLLVVPDPALPRIDSVALRGVLAVARALGTEVLHEHATPAELDGLEIWALNALHGIRVVTAWVDGPQPAELPGRAQLWRDRLDALRRPLPVPQTLPEPG